MRRVLLCTQERGKFPLISVPTCFGDILKYRRSNTPGPSEAVTLAGKSMEKMDSKIMDLSVAQPPDIGTVIFKKGYVYSRSKVV